MTVCLVTGGAGEGLGQGICEALAEAGHDVAVCDLDADRGETVATEIRRRGVRSRFFSMDVADLESVTAATRSVAGEFGNVGALVNNAGVGLIKPAGEVTEAEVTRLQGVDFLGAWRCIQAVLPGMVAAGSGSIVNIGSVHAFGAVRGYGLYAAAKAGLAALTRGIAVDYGPAGIRCNCVHPGLVDSPQSRANAALTGDAAAWMLDFVQTRQAIPAPIQPADIGCVVAFLIGDASRAITGANIPVDAGTTAMLFDRGET